MPASAENSPEVLQNLTLGTPIKAPLLQIEDSEWEWRLENNPLKRTIRRFNEGRVVETNKGEK